MINRKTNNSKKSFTMFFPILNPTNNFFSNNQFSMINFSPLVVTHVHTKVHTHKHTLTHKHPPTRICTHFLRPNYFFSTFSSNVVKIQIKGNLVYFAQPNSLCIAFFFLLYPSHFYNIYVFMLNVLLRWGPKIKNINVEIN